jgi:23S rRNA pseudouridine2605 synthase
MSCALPFDVKPTACLAFNPVTPDACEMDPKRFDAAHAPQAARNAEAGFPARRVAIPVAVLAALDAKIPQTGAGPVSAEPGTTRRATATAKPVALPRLLSKWGVCSRKEAETRVKDGRVALDGRVVRDVLKLVNPSTCKITIDGKAVSDGGGSGVHVWFAVNKPRGFVTTTKDPEGRRTVVDLFGDAPPQGVMPVGRLDADSAGLLLMTSDHAAADRLLDPDSHVEKTYRVKIRGALDAAAARRLLTEAIDDDGLHLGPFASLEPISSGPKSSWWLVGLREGKNRQIRRRFTREGCEVEVLVRTRFGAVALGDLAPGEVRPLTSAEVKALLGSSPPRPR